MAKIARKNMKIFGSNPGSQQIGVIGSLAAAAPAYSTDPETIQSLANYLVGWYGVVIGNNSPALQDFNAIHYLYAYQLAYIFQAGIAEWNSLTTYYIGSLAVVGSQIFVSNTDTNLNNAPLTSSTNWALYGSKSRTVTSNGAALVTDNTVRGNTTSGALSLTLPDVTTIALGHRTIFKNVGTNAANVLTITGFASETIDGNASVALNPTPYFESITCQWNGTSWDIV